MFPLSVPALRRAAVLGLVAALTASAAGAQAPAANLPPPTAAFPPPAAMDEAGVRAWVERNLDTKGWSLRGAEPSSVSFLSEKFAVGADGLRGAEVRREYFGAPRLGPLGARSVRQAWIVDCKARKIWVRRIMLFQESNMKGEGRARENPEPAWTEVSSGSINEKMLGEICAAPAGPPKPASKGAT